MAASNKYNHLTLDERRIIEIGITNGSSKKAIADTLGKDKSTIGKEIKAHRVCTYRSSYPVDCALFPHCKNKATQQCSPLKCPDYKMFVCKRRDRSPGACNGCDSIRGCRYDKYTYHAYNADNEYHDLLVNARIGVNASLSEIRKLGELIKPLLEQGQSIYAILENHPEIDVCEKTLYNYIEDGVFQNAGISINCTDLKRQVSRRMPKKKRIVYAPRQDRSYLKGRTYQDYLAFKQENPNLMEVEMDTVYNDVSNGPFIQTFKFLQYDLLFCIYQPKKDSEHMLNGILLLEEVLGRDIFDREAAILKTDRGSEFLLADKAEVREDGTRRTHLFYCDAMASWQKGSLENVHLLLREICPNKCDLHALGLTSQKKADLISSHINSYPKEKLKGKTSFQLLSFFSPDMAERLFNNGLAVIPSDEVTLKPYLLKQK